jgi:hypothetical protein
MLNMVLKALFAYHIEALVPSSPHGANTSQVPQKLSGTKDVHFFSVGTLQGRTLIVYMKKKGVRASFNFNFDLYLNNLNSWNQSFACWSPLATRLTKG